MKFLCFLIFSPMFIFGSVKEEIIEDFSTKLSNLDFQGAHQSLSDWENFYLEDKELIDSCRAFLLLHEGYPEQAKLLFESSTSGLQKNNNFDLSIDKISDIFHFCLKFFEQNSVDFQTSLESFNILPCSEEIQKEKKSLEN